MLDELMREAEAVAGFFGYQVKSVRVWRWEEDGATGRVFLEGGRDLWLPKVKPGDNVRLLVAKQL